jgi:cell division septation protein DedD
MMRLCTIHSVGAIEKLFVKGVSSASQVARALSCTVLGSLFVVALLGCDTRDDRWEEAVKTDTPDAYDSYLQKNPRSQRAAEARVRRDALVDQRDWLVARRTNSIEGYSAYLAAHADGVWSELATRRREALLELQSSVGSPATPTAEPAPVDDAASKSVTAGQTEASAPASVSVRAGYVIQLGAFSSNASARRSWQRLQRSFVELQGFEPRIDASPLKGSSLYRLRLALASKEQGDLLCAALKRGGAECVPSPSP